MVASLPTTARYNAVEGVAAYARSQQRRSVERLSGEHIAAQGETSPAQKSKKPSAFGRFFCTHNSPGVQMTNGKIVIKSSIYIDFMNTKRVALGLFCSKSRAKKPSFSGLAMKDFT